jgi:hypothetical protein
MGLLVTWAVEKKSDWNQATLGGRPDKNTQAQKNTSPGTQPVKLRSLVFIRRHKQSHPKLLLPYLTNTLDCTNMATTSPETDMATTSTETDTSTLLEQETPTATAARQLWVKATMARFNAISQPLIYNVRLPHVFIHVIPPKRRYGSKPNLRPL